MDAKGNKIENPDFGSAGNLNLLLVDDDDICIFIHTKIAEMSGCFQNICSASNGLLALDSLVNACKESINIPDIILLDLDMPVMDGFTFLEAYQRLDFEKKAAISVVILTSSASERDQQRGRVLGATHFLTKPLSMVKLQSVVRQAGLDSTQKTPGMPPPMNWQEAPN